MSNAGIGMAVHAIKIRVNEILLKRRSLNDVLIRFSEDRDVKIVNVNIENKEIIYHYDIGKLLYVKLIFDENYNTRKYEIFNSKSNRVLAEYEV